MQIINYEVERMFRNMISGWFEASEGNCNELVKAMLLDDMDAMDEYMNRESGFGRYDIMLEPLGDDDAIIIEFKVFNGRREETLEDTLAVALAQIEEKNYAQTLMDKGIGKERIRKYGFAFKGKEVLIRSSHQPE